METPRFFCLALRTSHRLMRRNIAELLRASKLMSGVITGFCLCYLGGAYSMGYRALDYVYKQFPLVGTIVLERMVFVTFGILMVMLIISTAVIGYTTLFKNKETHWLFPHPLSHETLFRWKSVEAMTLSSWAFVFLLIPLAIAYGHVYQAPWGYYLWLPLLLTAFVTFCGVFGLYLLFFFIWLSRSPLILTLIFFAGIAVIFALALSVFTSPPPDADALKTTNIMSQLLDNTRFLTHPLWPGYWLSRGLLSALDGAYSSTFYYFLLLASHALFFNMLSFTLLSRTYALVWNDVHTRSQSFQLPWKKKGTANAYPNRTILDLLRPLLRPFMGGPSAALAWKDAKTFFRDPQQWLQFAVFFGIMGVYVLNLQKMRIDVQTGFWSHFIAHMNLAASSMTLGTLTTRFVFPQFSLEGRRLWLVGLSPVGLRGVIWQKFWTSMVFSTVIVSGLTLISCVVLALPLWQTVQFILVIFLMGAALSSLSVGLGVLYPNFKEDNPAKIVSGFGGTLCLVLTFLYVALCVACLALPSQASIVGHLAQLGSQWPSVVQYSGLGIIFLLSIACITLPLWLAFQKAAELEL